ncbi:hypothetical protein CBL_07129 [Carabus blaptoides fortunei]
MTDGREEWKEKGWIGNCQYLWKFVFYVCFHYRYQLAFQYTGQHSFPCRSNRHKTSVQPEIWKRDRHSSASIDTVRGLGWLNGRGSHCCDMNVRAGVINLAPCMCASYTLADIRHSESQTSDHGVVTCRDVPLSKEYSWQQPLSSCDSIMRTTLTTGLLRLQLFNVLDYDWLTLFEYEKHYGTNKLYKHKEPAPVRVVTKKLIRCRKLLYG